MTNNSSTLRIVAYEQSYDGVDDITYTPPESLFDRYYFLANSQQNHFLFPMKQFHADHGFMSLNHHLREQGGYCAV